MSWWKALFSSRPTAAATPEIKTSVSPAQGVRDDVRTGSASLAANPALPAAPVSPARAASREDGLPNAFSLPSTGGRQIFDPALRSYSGGFRQADAPITEPAARQRWSAAREQVVACVLGAISTSPWASHLVLRGSATMPAWVGDAARRPGDLDWVVLPDTWASGSVEAESLLRGFIDAIAAHGVQAGDATIDVANVAFDDIWTYERADGKRLTFSWSVPGLPPGKLQCDFVFKEPLWLPPTRILLPISGGETIELLAAGPEQSLAWKILWLMTDGYPQGKDLYDAVLLADHVTLSPEMVGRTLAEIRAFQGADYFDRWFEEGDDWLDWILAKVEWVSFVGEYPWVDANRDAWIDRFRKVLTPMRDQAWNPLSASN